jgi:uncharacterized damage-inducible protein DinB
MDSDESNQLLGHMEWADALIWHTILQLPETHNDERIGKLLHHLHEVQQAHIQICQGKTQTIPERNSFTDMNSFYRWGQVCHSDLKTFVSTLTPMLLEQTVEFPWARTLIGKNGEIHPVNIRQSLLQIVMHSTYHRGQINTRIRELGGKPPLTDFIVWLWMGKPDARWVATGN